MKLYLIRGNDVDGENQDWFVVAGDPAEAASIWNDYLITEGCPRDDNDTEEELPRKRTVNPANIREILDDVEGTKYAGTPRALDWDEMTIVA